MSKKIDPLKILAHRLRRRARRQWGTMNDELLAIHVWDGLVCLVCGSILTPDGYSTRVIKDGDLDVDGRGRDGLHSELTDPCAEKTRVVYHKYGVGPLFGEWEDEEEE